MSSLRPSSVCDTTPLRRLESQSSASEPSSPTLNGICAGAGGSAASVVTGTGSTGTTVSTASTTTTPTLSLANHNNNKIDIHLNNYVNDGLEKQKMAAKNGARKIFCRILWDLVILACVSLPILAFTIWGEAHKRGFFCDDESLKHPFRLSTVKSWMLYLMCLVVPTILIVAVEFFKSNSNKMHGFNTITGEQYYIYGLEVPDWIIECYKKIGALVFGAGMSQLTTDVAKYSIGRLRPHFIAVCQPLMYDGSTCEDPINQGHYIEDFDCRGLDVSSKLLKEMRLSFPSGHATFACFAMLYIAIYLQRRMTWRSAKMFKHLLQFAFLMFAWYTALTRVSDYKHHWTDVLAGAVIGNTYAILVTLALW